MPEFLEISHPAALRLLRGVLQVEQFYCTSTGRLLLSWHYWSETIFTCWYGSIMVVGVFKVENQDFE